MIGFLAPAAFNATVGALAYRHYQDRGDAIWQVIAFLNWACALACVAGAIWGPSS